MLRAAPAPRPCRASLLSALAILTWASTAPAAPPRYAINAELGPELDSNARRQASDEDAPLASGLMRVVVDAQLRLKRGRHSVALGYGGGARVFLQDAARAADELVQRASLRWSAALGPSSQLALLGSYYDAFQRESTQDFRTGSALLRLALGKGLTTASLFSGYQGLEFKPFDDYGFHGLAAGASVSREVRKNELASWRFSLGYNAALRAFNGGILAEGRRDPCAEDASSCGRSRSDLAQTFELGAHYAGEALADAWYTAEINHSNSFGETFVRHAVGVKFTSLLFWGVFFTAKGVLRFSRFRDPFLFVSATQSRFVDIDDENRSTLLLHLGRDIAEHWTAVVRYSLHINESSGGDATVRPAGFQRHLVFVGIQLRYGNEPD